MKRLLINSSFWELMVFILYLISSTAFFNRVTYNDGYVWVFMLFFLWIVTFINLLTVVFKRNYKILIPINILLVLFMISEMALNKKLHEGFLYPSILVSKYKWNTDKSFKYRIYVENFYQANTKFYLQVNYKGETSYKIPLINLDQYVEEYLIYRGNESNLKSQDGFAMLPSSVGFILAKPHENTIYLDFNIDKVIEYSIQIPKKGEYENIFCGNIIKDTIKKCK